MTTFLQDPSGTPIHTLDDWRRLAPPKSEHHWVEGRSALKLARAWTTTGTPAIPPELAALLDTHPETRNLVPDQAIPELRIRFDTHRGEPRNADLALLGRAGNRTIALSIEAKADEPFGTTVAGTRKAAARRLTKNPRSAGLKRLDDLLLSLLPPRQPAQPPADTLRYQLLTATAGTLAYARQHDADLAVLVIHEFVTDQTTDPRHQANARDLTAFLHRLAAPFPSSHTTLQGPLPIPGPPLFPGSTPLLIGKAVTRLR